MRAIWLILIFLPFVCTPEWVHTNERCGTPENLHCTSGGMIGAPLHGAYAMRATLQVTPARDGRFWAGIVLNGDVAADNLYTQAAIVNNIIPYRNPYAPTDGPASVILVNGGDHCCTILAHDIDTTQPHAMYVSYDGIGNSTICVDGICDQVHINLGDSYVPELQCGGGETGDTNNPVGCSFTNIVVSPMPN